MAIPDAILDSACALYQTDPAELTPLSGGHYNAVFGFSAGERPAILRIGVADCPMQQTLSMMEWVRYVSSEGGPVAAPLLSVNRHLVETLLHYGKPYTITAFEKASGTLAENIPVTEWSDDLFCNLGSVVGKLHRISSTYQPSKRSHARPCWYESAEIGQATQALASRSPLTSQKLSSLVDELKLLPTSRADFGLIHGDLHFANFLVDPAAGITIVDFDDCAYGWFAMDVAMALFDVLVLYAPVDEADAWQFTRRFLSSYLAGYRQEFGLGSSWLAHLPHFLKLKELCIYAMLLDHPDISQPGTWVGNFMHGRAERIEQDLPYAAFDFLSLDDAPGDRTLPAGGAP